MSLRFSFLLALVFTCFQFVAQAQPGREYSVDDNRAIKLYEKGLSAYNQMMMEEAEDFMIRAVDKNASFIEPRILLGQIYAEQNMIEKSISQIETAIEIDSNFFPNNHFFLGELYLTQGMYQKALTSFQKFESYGTGSPTLKDRSVLNIRSCEYALLAVANPVPFEPENLGDAINSAADEYYPCLTADEQTMLYTRAVADRENRTGYQEDFYISNKENNEWVRAQPVKEINTEKNEGAPTLSPDGQVLIFTACEIDGDWGGNRNGLGHCDLFFSQKIGPSWSEPRNLGERINSYSWESQPSYSADGRTIYFVRGKTTARGVQEQDIWVSNLHPQGFWQKPRKLEGPINTPYEEESVMIHPDGKTLYFSSNGHPGLGGLDIFVSRKDEDGKWGEPQNLGYPINTKDDENSLLVSASGDISYFASDREGGQGGLDLYKFKLYNEARPQMVTYAQGVVFDAKTKERLGARFELIDLESGEQVVESYSNPGNGEFLVSLPSGRDYALNVSREGYLFYSDNFTLSQESATAPKQLEVPLKRIEEGSSVVLNNVFFDVDQYKLKPQSKVELDKLIEFLKLNPELRIEISGHTDNVGTDEANKVLSQNRAQSVVDYLLENGISKDRLSAKGFGESKPIASNDNEEGRAKNRRTEFEVIGK
jgi:outer membrane protein OmpA-like peptidoglycan-associated protein